ncbi:hypothetical protein cyc_06586 [Cyclospora cayetanensis]|uniref:Uncharacterized protein n=1 Tax=Cyclospora cayetanensis TaxID=88456 RepID=A0A1D3CTG0_9EIME|nr:hypothetical protein cyc_06586 [Cyclospora cayetanensis]
MCRAECGVPLTRHDAENNGSSRCFCPSTSCILAWCQQKQVPQHAHWPSPDGEAVTLGARVYMEEASRRPFPSSLLSVLPPRAALLRGNTELQVPLSDPTVKEAPAAAATVALDRLRSGDTLSHAAPTLRGATHPIYDVPSPLLPSLPETPHCPPLTLPLPPPLLPSIP